MYIQILSSHPTSYTQTYLNAEGYDRSYHWFYNPRTLFNPRIFREFPSLIGPMPNTDEWNFTTFCDFLPCLQVVEPSQPCLGAFGRSVPHFFRLVSQGTNVQALDSSEIECSYIAKVWDLPRFLQSSFEFSSRNDNLVGLVCEIRVESLWSSCFSELGRWSDER